MAFLNLLIDDWKSLNELLKMTPQHERAALLVKVDIFKLIDYLHNEEKLFHIYTLLTTSDQFRMTDFFYFLRASSILIKWSIKHLQRTEMKHVHELTRMPQRKVRLYNIF